MQQMFFQALQDHMIGKTWWMERVTGEWLIASQVFGRNSNLHFSSDCRHRVFIFYYLFISNVA